MVEIVTFDPDVHRAPWQDFIVSSYGNPHYVLLSPTYLRWQFLDNPANRTGGYTLGLVLHKGAVVAQLGFVPFAGSCPNGQPFEGAYPINLIVRPEYRAVGLGAILLDRLLKQTPFVLNPGASEPGAALSEGLGMADLGTLRRYLAITDAAAAAALTEAGQLPEGVAEAATVSEPQRADVIATGVLPDEAPDRFAFPMPVFGAERSRSFLQWRYQRHPSFDYEFLLSGDHRSLAVVRQERETSTGALVMRIVDLLAQAEHQDDLLRAVLRQARECGAAIVDFYCSLDCYDAACRRAGFFDEAEHGDRRIAARFQPLTLRKTTIRVTASGSGERAALRDWYVTKGDSDQDRPTDCRTAERRRV
jgi:hypothetical protein